MRVIPEDIIEKRVYKAINEANTRLPEDVVNSLKKACENEEGIAKYTLKIF